MYCTSIKPEKIKVVANTYKFKDRNDIVVLRIHLDEDEIIIHVNDIKELDEFAQKVVSAVSQAEIV